MIISETKLRKIIKDEMINEIFGFGKKQTKRKRHFVTSNVEDFVKALKVARKAISKPTAEQKEKFLINNFYESLRVRSQKEEMIQTHAINNACDGVDYFKKNVFPFISKFSYFIKEGVDLRKEDNMPFYVGLVLDGTLNGIISRLRLSGMSKTKFSGMAKEYYETLSQDEKSELDELINFYVKLFRFLNKYDTKDLLQKRLDLIYPDTKRSSLGDDTSPEGLVRFQSGNVSEPPSISSPGTMTPSSGNPERRNFDSLEFDTWQKKSYKK